MKPGSRAEFEWVPNDPVTVGHIEPDRDASESNHPAAVLWVPDPEQRYGWRELYVRRPVTKPSRRVGFGR